MTEMKTKTKKILFFLLDNPVTLMVITYLLIVAGQILGANLVYFAGQMIPSIAATDAWRTSNLYLRFVGIWVVTLLLLALIPYNRPMLKALGKKLKGNTLKMFGVGLAIGLGMNLLCALIAMVNGDIALTFHSFRPVSFLLVFIAVLIQSAAEELICRVYMYQRLLRFGCKPIVAAVINASFFAIVHLGNPGVTPISVVSLFLSGMLLSAMVVYMDSPWAAMACHAGWNFCQNILLGLPNSGTVVPYSVFKLDAAAATDSFAYSVSFGLEGAMTACIIHVVAIGLIVWWGTRRKTVPTNVWAAEI
ncbi:MAG: type II CAAX endopeptidase family protein [Oscillospiraceae bacterium]